MNPETKYFLKAVNFYLLQKIWAKIGENISKNLSGNEILSVLDHTKQSAADAFKIASKRAIQKTAEATADLIDCKIADKIMGK